MKKRIGQDDSWFDLWDLLLGAVFVMLLAFVVWSFDAGAAGHLDEVDYQNAWCEAHGGIKTNDSFEYVLPDRTRVDCLTMTHAIEFDFAHKWAEAIGQSLHYGRVTGSHAGIVLIVGPDEYRFVSKLFQIVIDYKLDIHIWLVPK